MPAATRSSLRDYFPRVLAEVVARGGQEVIFIDGLGQLEEDPSGTRDLSFLPVEPPAGIVFVLGTRPDDTLQPLALLKPRDEYRLPNLSRGDFDLILQHYGVTLDSAQAEQFYTAMGQNALYLDLVAKELKALAESNALRPEEVIRRLADNPDNLFSLAMSRLKRNHRQWREVIKPLLGVLLATREPIGLRMVGRQREAIGLVELMTKASRKAMMSAFLAHQLVRRAGDLRETRAHVITCFHNPRRWMPSDAYLAAGLPVATGVVESAGGSVVQPRREGDGKRWSLTGAEALLALRSLKKRHDHERRASGRCRARQVRTRLYGRQPQ